MAFRDLLQHSLVRLYILLERTELVGVPNRAESIRGIGYTFDCGIVTAQNVSKALTKASGRNSVAIGRGNRDIPMWLGWFVSMSLGVVISDLKNCRRKVESVSNLVPHSGRTKHIEYQNLLLKYSELGSQTSHHRKLRETEKVSDLFEEFCLLVMEVAHDWDGLGHQSMRQGFRFVLSTGNDLWAEVDRFVCVGTDGQEIWQSVKYGPAHRQGQLTTSRFSKPVSRQAIITIEHVEALALLWADSSRQGNIDPSRSLSAPKIEEFPELANQVRLGTANENAGSLPGEPAPFRDQDRDTRNTIQSPHSLDNGGENKNSQPSSCRGSGRSATSSPTGRSTHVGRARRHGSIQHKSVQPSV